jgi:O-antigen/teichoic acid export membrane protein
MAVDRQRQWVMLSVAAAVFNPVLNLVAIPLTERTFRNGAIGAAIVTVLTEALVLVGALRLRPAGVFDAPMARLAARVVVASLCMVPVVVMLGSAPLPAQVAAGAATYIAASLALGTVPIGEVRNALVGVLGRWTQQSGVTP